MLAIAELTGDIQNKELWCTLFTRSTNLMDETRVR